MVGRKLRLNKPSFHPPIRRVAELWVKHAPAHLVDVAVLVHRQRFEGFYYTPRMFSRETRVECDLALDKLNTAWCGVLTAYLLLKSSPLLPPPSFPSLQVHGRGGPLQQVLPRAPGRVHVAGRV